MEGLWKSCGDRRPLQIGRRVKTELYCFCVVRYPGKLLCFNNLLGVLLDFVARKLWPLSGAVQCDMVVAGCGVFIRSNSAIAPMYSYEPAEPAAMDSWNNFFASADLPRSNASSPM